MNERKHRVYNLSVQPHKTSRLVIIICIEVRIKTKILCRKVYLHTKFNHDKYYTKNTSLTK